MTTWSEDGEYTSTETPPSDKRVFHKDDNLRAPSIPRLFQYASERYAITTGDDELPFAAVIMQSTIDIHNKTWIIRRIKIFPCKALYTIDETDQLSD
jgi:hypothetical protein